MWRMIISAEWRATAGDSARKGVRAGHNEWGEGLAAWLSRPHPAEGLPLGGPSALFQSWTQDRIRENRWKYRRTGLAIQGFRYKLGRSQARRSEGCRIFQIALAMRCLS